ncbi:Protein of unknown function [Bacillus wiedmannii]|nr:Protein of unknown function [Bacillus wiedmannii]
MSHDKVLEASVVGGTA